MFGSKKPKKRFISTKLEGTDSGNLVSIITDTETGVQYLSIGGGGVSTGGGVTVLVDKDGKPLLNEDIK
ncbi:DUF6440 family protein [Lentilactobacillus kefiri]|uniref:DUF6440 family protein n=1 Tax=Lentilactobacillus kefiri TaxID=33962 RepID=UPI000BA7A3A2|nr:DUF6440 family protein [Lentilactobacillus kefiri]MCJ2162545.1 DUF6440 family protein [Lentilactobacillus kefiri]MCP9369753.1 hypothetical protein [Lentilactobacillus kefiri]MDM7494027.1 DUF6440 family protein [Lentilactobacillus kefiri]PAK58769.1 hypothetical protein B9K02_09635 [Lentilactobacillus kefiri]PAK81530.1 hypothetical protein B8W85_09675 [Lentilactobacillus kefiri]